MSDGISSPNVPASSNVTEVLGHEDLGGGLRRLIRAPISAIVNAAAAQVQTAVAAAAALVATANSAALTAFQAAQSGGLASFLTLAEATTNIASFSNYAKIRIEGGTADDGEYRKLSGAWQYIGPLSVSRREYNQLLTHTRRALLRPGQVAVYDGGEPIDARVISANYAGFATPFNWSGASADLALFAYRVEAAGCILRFGIWSGNQATRLCWGDVIANNQEGLAVIKLDKILSTTLISAGVLYATLHVVGGTTRLQGHNIAQYVDVAAPGTYPQRYMSNLSPQELLTNWTTLSPNVGFPVAFKLYNSAALDFKEPIGPRPDQLVVPPRLFGVGGVTELNVYWKSLRRGQAHREWAIPNASDSGFGQIQQERWTWPPGTLASITNGFIDFACVDPDFQGEVLSKARARLDIVPKNTVGGASKRALVIGDSLTDDGAITQRCLSLSAANASDLQLVLVGTRGTGLNKHEGRAGWTVGRYFAPTGGDVALNPFCSGSGQKFNAAYYLSSTSQAAPKVIVWELLINDVANLTSDDAVRAQMITSMSQLDKMIGIVADGTVGSWLAVSSGIKHLVCIPPDCAETQDGFGATYGIGVITRQRYRQNVFIAQNMLIEHYRAQEANGIYLVPTNVAVDPSAGFSRAAQTPKFAARPVDYTYTTYALMIADLNKAAGVSAFAIDVNAYFIKLGGLNIGKWRDATEQDGFVSRQNNTVHPGIGYLQMGDQIWAGMNWMTATGVI